MPPKINIYSNFDKNPTHGSAKCPFQNIKIWSGYLCCNESYKRFKCSSSFKKRHFSSDFVLLSKIHICSNFEKNPTPGSAACTLQNAKTSSCYLFWNESFKAFTKVSQISKNIIFTSGFALTWKINICRNFDKNPTHCSSKCSLRTPFISSRYF